MPDLIDEKALIKALRSKRFLVFFIALVINLVVALRPEFAPHAEQVMTLTTLIALVLIGGYSAQDAFAAANANKDLYKEHPGKLAAGAATEILEANLEAESDDVPVK